MLCLLKVLSRDAVHHNTSYRIKKYKKLVPLIHSVQIGVRNIHLEIAYFSRGLRGVWREPWEDEFLQCSV